MKEIKKILVLRGGPSSEFEVSLRSGKAVHENLKDDFQLTDCVIDKQGNWVVNGVTWNPRQLSANHDLVFNAMHGEYGEDGTVQALLESFGVPYTGSDSFGSRIAMNKASAKRMYKRHGLKTPEAIVIERTENLDNLAINLFRSFPMPVVIKPIDRGSSVGISIARDYKSLLDTLRSLFVHYDRLLVEEYIQGKEATMGIIDKFRNNDIYALLPVQIVTPKEKEFFDYEAKYTGITQEICPGDFSRNEISKLEEMAKMAHQVLGQRHYSRSDFIVHPKRGVFILETNSLPGLTEQSLMPKSLVAVGSDLKEFLRHVISIV